ncbi:MAG: hypothetical protein ABIH42_01895, partial [Planctomycetota bacterium]
MKAVWVILFILSVVVLFLAYQSFMISSELDSFSKEVSIMKLHGKLEDANHNDTSNNTGKEIEERIVALEKSKVDIESEIGNIAKKVSTLPNSQDKRPAAAADNKFLTQKEIKELIKSEISSSNTNNVKQPDTPVTPVRKKLTIREFAQEAGLSAGQESALNDVMMEMDNEYLKLLVNEGETVEDFKQKLIQAKDNPVLLEEITGQCVKNGLSKLDKMITIAMDSRKKVRSVLDEEQMEKFNQYQVVSSEGI